MMNSTAVTTSDRASANCTQHKDLSASPYPPSPALAPRPTPKRQTNPSCIATSN